MGELIEGVWRDQAPASSGDGRFHRAETRFRNWITADGRPGPTGQGGFKAEPGRYHLYVSLACPWAHRTLIMRRLKGLEDAIGVSVVHWHMDRRRLDLRARGRVLPATGCTASTICIRSTPRPGRTIPGRVTVPVLWDKERGTIVNNESSEIIRMLNSAFDRVGADGPRLLSAAAAAGIDAINDRVYDTVNNGVYKAGFARSQEAYEEAVTALFATLDWPRGRCSARSAISPAIGSPRPTGACSRRWSASIRSMSATSSATCAAWSTTRTSGPTRASCTRCRASPRPWTSTTSSSTTTAATDR